MSEIRTTVDIDAARADVWAALTDFAAYPEWNRFMRVEGRLNPGARLLVDLRPPGARAASFRPTITRVERGRGFEWRGHLFVPGLFDGDHGFELTDIGDGRTRLTHSETFRGVLAGPLTRYYGGATERGFREMNEALKARVEGRKSGGDAGAAADTGGTTPGESADPDADAAA
jgi:hypothetical protein